MTRDEFRAWWRHHAARFTGLRTWLERIPEVDRRDVLAAWFVALRWVALETAKEASERLFGDERAPPYDRHPAAIRRIAAEIEHEQRASRRSRPCRADGVETVACTDCEDTGVVVCWHPLSVEAARRGEADLHGSPPRKTLAFACRCRLGESFAAIGTARYDLVQHCRVEADPTLPCEREHLIEWIGEGSLSRAQEWRPG